jgi:hypothetical protein
MSTSIHFSPGAGNGLVGVAVGDGVDVGEGVAVKVGVDVGVAVAVLVGVAVDVGVAVAVGVLVGVHVAVAVGVAVGGSNNARTASKLSTRAYAPQVTHISTRIRSRPVLR